MQFSSLLWPSDVPVPAFCIPAPIRSFGTSKFLSAGKSSHWTKGAWLRKGLLCCHLTNEDLYQWMKPSQMRITL